MRISISAHPLPCACAGLSEPSLVGLGMVMSWHRGSGQSLMMTWYGAHMLYSRALLGAGCAQAGLCMHAYLCCCAVCCAVLLVGGCWGEGLVVRPVCCGAQSSLRAPVVMLQPCGQTQQAAQQRVQGGVGRGGGGQEARGRCEWRYRNYKHQGPKNSCVCVSLRASGTGVNQLG